MARPRIIHNFPLNKFYETSQPLSAGKPGELIRFAEFDYYDLPRDVSAVRILYHSLSANDEDVPVSGVVLFPNKQAPAGGWPIIAWAHDLNGVARNCAPSLARNLRHGSFLSMYVQLGYAVVATDYAGLGSRGRNAFADMNSNATDLLYSVAAARKAVPQLGERWIAMGTGEGSLAIVAMAQQKGESRDSGYLGGIAISGLEDLEQEYKSSQNVSSGALLDLVYGIQTVYPKFHPDDVLNSSGMILYNRIGTDCEGEAATTGTPSIELAKAKWQSNHFVQQYFSRNHPDISPIKRPLLVLSSGADPHAAETRKFVTRLCSVGDKVQFLKYPGADPAALIGDSVRDQMQWIQEIFANRPPHGDCSTEQ